MKYSGLLVSIARPSKNLNAYGERDEEAMY